MKTSGYSMKIMLSWVAVGCITLGTLISRAADEIKPGDRCPITGKPANPKCSLEYEGKIYTFCKGECRTKFNEDRINSLYHRLGGKAALSAAVDLFYTKVLADKRVSHFFEDVNMKRQHNRQKAFLSAALGGPEPWTGKDLRKAHASLDLNESHFNAIAGHLRATLEELKIKPDLINQVMAVVAGTKDDVLNRKKDSR
jgi:hemoglobin